MSFKRSHLTLILNLSDHHSIQSSIGNVEDDTVEGDQKLVGSKPSLLLAKNTIMVRYTVPQGNETSALIPFTAHRSTFKTA